jgi:hypothetical protein
MHISQTTRGCYSPLAYPTALKTADASIVRQGSFTHFELNQRSGAALGGTFGPHSSLIKQKLEKLTTKNRRTRGRLSYKVFLSVLIVCRCYK